MSSVSPERGRHRIARLLFRGVVAGLLLAMLSGCGFMLVRGVRHAFAEHAKQQSAVEAGLARYGVYRASMQPDKMADMFEPGGELSRDSEAPVIGRQAILDYLTASSGHKVLEYEVTATSTALDGTNATQRGRYREKIESPAGNIVAVHGRFEATWSYHRSGQWFISSMHTTQLGDDSGA